MKLQHRTPPSGQTRGKRGGKNASEQNYIEDHIHRADNRHAGLHPPSLSASRSGQSKTFCSSFCFFKRGYHGAQADPKLTQGLRKTSNYKYACLHLPSAGVEGVSHHTVLMRCWGWKSRRGSHQDPLGKFLHSQTKVCIWKTCCEFPCKTTL